MFIRSAPILSGIECLTSLFLKYVDIPDETIEHLLSVCPLLEQLWLEWSSHLFSLRVVGSSLKLKYLGIICCGCLKNLEICAPNLVSFHFGKEMMMNTKLRVKGLFSLADLFIDAMDMYADIVLFSSYFSQLESLKLTFRYDSRFWELLGLPQLTNLKHLTFKIREVQHGMLGLFKFLNLCPFLEKFTLELCADVNSREIRIDMGNSLPRQYLKVVEMVGFVGRGHEI